ncbi:hypothetical protein BHS05_01085 [Myxococcus xanthus]|nr:hypothetical protein BHS05_01085 [Myxococcus xanthus]QDF01812.1 hypothetical protein BHS04_01075 [Myxococcus xanthus]
MCVIPGTQKVVTNMLAHHNTQLVALSPAPSTLAEGATPPWPPPPLRVQPKPPAHYQGTTNAIIIGIGLPLLGAYALYENERAVAMVGFIGGLLAWSFAALRFSQERKTRQNNQAEHVEHVRRAILTWARITDSAIVEQVPNNDGRITHYLLDLHVTPWHPSNPAPRQVPLRLRVPVAHGPHVVPGAYLGVLSDPEAAWVVPQSLLTLQGAQLPL